MGGIAPQGFGSWQSKGDPWSPWVAHSSRVGQPGWPSIKTHLSVSGASNHPSRMGKSRTDCMSPHSVAGWSATCVPLPPDTRSDSLVRLQSTVTWIILPHSQDFQRNEHHYGKDRMFSSFQRKESQYGLLLYQCWWKGLTAFNNKNTKHDIKMMQFIPSPFIPTFTVSNHFLELLHAANNFLQLM